jgi:hypothetical protein
MEVLLAVLRRLQVLVDLRLADTDRTVPPAREAMAA